ncbi:MAG: hypothetical protein GY842_08680 [bacterium]|nr:hypothetical protein [bacterium]
MACTLLNKWLAHYDPIHRGYTLRGIANGVCAMGGWSFPRVGGGYNLYRGNSGPEQVDYDAPVGAAGAESDRISNFSWRPHGADTEHFYALRAIGGGGVESAQAESVVSVAFGAGGEFVGGRPHGPVGLAVEAVAGGKFRVSWGYSPVGEEAEAVEFRVYSDGGDGIVDYEQVVGQVPHRPGTGQYSYTSDAHEHGARRRWSVRAVSATGREEGNQASVRATADSAGPPTPVVLVELIGDEC